VTGGRTIRVTHLHKYRQAGESLIPDTDEHSTSNVGREHTVRENASEVLIIVRSDKDCAETHYLVTSTFALPVVKMNTHYRSILRSWYCVPPVDMVDCYETQANGGGSYSVDPRASMYHKLLQEGGPCLSGDLPTGWANGCPATDTINQSIMQSDTS
jgi:hypothetical protein